MGDFGNPVATRSLRQSLVKWQTVDYDRQRASANMPWPVTPKLRPSLPARVQVSERRLFSGMIWLANDGGNFGHGGNVRRHHGPELEEGSIRIMKLYLVQHGEAKSKAEDPQRPLTERGREDVARVALSPPALACR